MEPYEVGDTIYFESDRGDIDTIFISKVDSVEECGILMTGKRKDIFYEIQHLPYNNWIFGKNLHRNGEISEINQSLIFLSKNLYEPSKDDYSIHIQYRNFSGELDFGKSQKDDYLKELGIEEYWKLESDTADWKEFGHDTLLIMEVVWTKKLGLTKYIKRNKEVFTTIR